MEKRKSLSKRTLPYISDLPYKLFYFTFYAGYMPFLLYLPVYFKYIGLSAVNVGILNGIRPILQSVGTPVLIMVGEKFHSRKLILVVSSIVMIGKVLVIFLFLRPKNQVCTATAYLNESHVTIIERTSETIQHKLSKRGAAEREWLPQSHLTNAILKKPNGYTDMVAKRLLPKKGNTANNDDNNATNASTQNTSFTKLMSNNINQPAGINRSKIPFETIPPTVITTKTSLPANQSVKYHVVDDQDEVHRIFIALLILVILADWFDSAIFTLVDHSCVVNMNVENYGYIRLWGNLGWGMMTPIIGVIIHRFDHEFCGKLIGSFHYVFFFFIAFSYISLLIGSHLDFETDPRDNIASKVQGVQDNFQYGILLFASSYSGFCNGFLFTFVNWFIDSLGGNALIMGIATGCKCAVDVALFFFLGRIIEAWGHVVTTSVGLVGYIAVFLVYFAVNQAWLVVLAETIHAVCYALVASTSVAFLIFAAPAGSSPRMQGILQGIYWGFGTGCGSIFGGYCVQAVGFNKTFLSFTVITCVVTFVFLVIQLFAYVNSDKDAGIYSMETNSSFDGDDEGSTTEESERENLESFKLLKKN